MAVIPEYTKVGQQGQELSVRVALAQIMTISAKPNKVNSASNATLGVANSASSLP